MAKQVNYTQILVEAGKAIGISAAINALLFYVLPLVGLLDTKQAVADGTTTVNLIGVVVSTIIFMSIGTVVYLLLVRFSGNPAKIFTWVCVIGSVLLLGNPFLAGFPTMMAIGLDLMHIAPAYFLWRFLTRTAG